MTREAILISVMVGMSLLIIAKSDKQFIHLLEGKLFHLNRDMGEAASVYRKHTALFAVVLFIVGFVAIGVAIMLLTNDNDFFWAPAFLSMVLIGLGIWSRIKSFRAAAQELDETGDLRRSAEVGQQTELR